MKITAFAAALLFAGAAHAQTAPQTPPAAEPSANDLTRDLNSRPPTIDEYLARPMTPPATSAPAPRTSPPAETTTRPASTAATPAPRATTPRPAASSAASPAPTAPATTAASPAATRPAPVRPAPTRPTVPAAEAPAVAPAPAPAPAPAAAAPAVTVLNAAARAALPFSVELPPGFEIVTGRPGPDFRIYTIRRGSRSFAMVYAGPASQFPIYSGEMVEAGGRASVVSTENGVRHAMEHLFQRPDSPREIHVWTMSLDGADRAMAEQIAQSVDIR
jgi:hypothetical protein